MDHLPHINASLNGLAAVLLVVGVAQVRFGRIELHKKFMLSSFVVSTIFLVSYLTYHYAHGHTKFPTYPPDGVRYFYLGMLASHILLAAAVPILAIITIYLGWKDRRAAHRKIAKWTYPIWLYVSITGVMVYLMLYHLYPPEV